MREKSHQGFTIIEVIVVIGIIGVLSAVVMVSTDSTRSKARDAQRISDIEQIKTALGLFKLENGYYPLSGNCDTTVPSNVWCNSIESVSNGHWIRNGTEDLTGFIDVDPIDPKPLASPDWVPKQGGVYFYYSGNGGSWYMIVFGLENRNSSMELTDGVTACDASRTYYHYGSSGNSVITTGVGC